MPVETAAIYARVSTLAQGEDWHASLDSQVKECTAFAIRQGYTVDPDLIAKEPYSATTMDRPLFERLLRQVEHQGIRQLILDKPDRVTRSGQQDAAYFMRRLWDADVTVSFALTGLVCRPGDEIAQSMFLNFALFAKLDNAQRVAIIQRQRKEAARSFGRYMRGNRPPYGWRVEAKDIGPKGEPLNFRLVHDDDGPEATWPVLLRIIRERQAGRSYQHIAQGLAADRVPLSTALAGHRNAAGKTNWKGTTVQAILKNPLNAGIVTAYRSHTVTAPPDARHATRWQKQVPVPLEEQIVLPDLVVEPPLTPEQWRWLISPAAYAAPASDGTAAHISANFQKHRTLGTTAAEMAMGYGGLFRHKDCGGGLRVKYNRAQGKLYSYYVCNRHMETPTVCPEGLPVLRVDDLDALVWDALVREVLLVPGKLQELAEAQRQADMAGHDPNGALQRWHRVRADLLAKQESLLDSVENAKDRYVRRLAEERLATLGAQLADVDARLAEAQAVAVNEQQRQAVLDDVEMQVIRHALLLDLAPALETPARVSFQRRVLRALGFSATVERTADGRFLVEAELHLAAGQPGLWFVDETEQREWEAALNDYAQKALRGEPVRPVVPLLTGVQGAVQFVTPATSGR